MEQKGDGNLLAKSGSVNVNKYGSGAPGIILSDKYVRILIC